MLRIWKENKVVKHKNKDNKLLSTRTKKMRLLTTRTRANEVAMRKNKSEGGC